MFGFGTNQFPVEGRTVLITGGSRGLGRGAARQLAEKGANVIIVARDAGKLNESIEYIAQGARDPKTQRFHHISANVTTADECVRVVQEATTWNNDSPPDIVWCVAGSCHPTLFVDTPIDQFQIMMDQNYFSCVYMAHAIMNVWLKYRKQISSTDKGIADPSTTESSSTRPPARHLIFTASFITFYTFIGWSPYSPAKAALRSLCDALSQEMNLYEAAAPRSEPLIRVHTVYPATMPTESLEAENKVKTDVTHMLEEGDTVLQPEEVARRAIRGLERGEEMIPTSFLIRLVMTSVLSGTTRGGFFTGLCNTLLSWIVVIVMLFVRGDMDSKVRKFGKEHGPSGMKTKA